MQIKNLKEISINGRRRGILEILPEVFDDMNPESACRRSIEQYREEIRNASRLHVLGFGKAAYDMYSGVRDAIEQRIATATIIIPEDQEIGKVYPELRILRGTHPYTGESTLKSSQAAMNALSDLHRDDLVLVLISGGGSALFEIPEDGISITDISEISRCLMNSDADIYDLNIVRSSISSVKGGKLAGRLFPARVLALVISDVVGDDLGIIASGPLQESRYTRKDLVSVLNKYREHCAQLLENVEKHGKAGELPDENFERVESTIVLKNLDFVNAIAAKIAESEENVINLGSGINGDVDTVSALLTDIMRTVYSLRKSPFWFVAGGETTVNVTGSGTGGRNCELSLRVLDRMRKDERFLFMSIGTDGIDGTSPAMGGIVDTTTRNSINSDEIRECLQNNDSYNLLGKYRSAIISGRTGNNVSDVIIGFYDGQTPGNKQ